MKGKCRKRESAGRERARPEKRGEAACALAISVNSGGRKRKGTRGGVEEEGKVNSVRARQTKPLFEIRPLMRFASALGPCSYKKLRVRKGEEAKNKKEHVQDRNEETQHRDAAACEGIVAAEQAPCEERCAQSGEHNPLPLHTQPRRSARDSMQKCNLSDSAGFSIASRPENGKK